MLRICFDHFIIFVLFFFFFSLSLFICTNLLQTGSWKEAYGNLIFSPFKQALSKQYQIPQLQCDTSSGLRCNPFTRKLKWWKMNWYELISVHLLVFGINLLTSLVTMIKMFLTCCPRQVISLLPWFYYALTQICSTDKDTRKLTNHIN